MTTPPAELPVCPRHPDRVSYVRCQRCGRPTCVDCQRPAAVGVHCVDCVRAARATQPQTRTAFGAPLRRGPAVVTITVIALNVISYVLQLAVGAPWQRPLVFAPFLGEAEPWRFLTSAFLHSPTAVYHILFNMLALWLVGAQLEFALGRARYVTLYLLSAVGGSVGVLLLASPADESWVVGVVGASGAVFGLFGAILVVLRRVGRSAQPIIGVLVINAILGFVVPGIAWQAHLGGLVVGIALGLAFAYAPRQWRAAVAVVAPLLVGAVLLVLAVAKYAWT